MVTAGNDALEFHPNLLKPNNEGANGMENVKQALDGKKTYIVLGLGIAYNILAKMGWMPESMSDVAFNDFANSIFAFGSLVFMRMGIKKTPTITSTEVKK